MPATIYPGFRANEPTDAGRAIVVAPDAAAQRALLGVPSLPDPEPAAGTLAAFDGSGGLQAAPPVTVNWGDILGTLSNQADLQAALDAKQDYLGYTPVNRAGDTMAGGLTVPYVGLNGNTGVYSDTANVVAIRNGANPQSLHVYNTYTDSLNYERGGMWWDGANNFIVGTENAGTGASRPLLFQVNGVNFANVASDGSYFNWRTNVRPDGSNLRDLGASGQRWRDVYASTIDVDTSATFTVGLNGLAVNYLYTTLPVAKFMDSAKSAGLYLPNSYDGTWKNLAIKAASGQTAPLTEWQDSAGTAKVVVMADGKVGIGTATPSYPLHVVGEHIYIEDPYPKILSSNDLQIYINDGTQAATFAQTYVLLNTLGVGRMLIDAGGNVGIGTTSPEAQLHVANYTLTAVPRILSGRGYTVNGVASKAIFTGGMLYEYPGIVGVGHSANVVDIPSIGWYGTVGVVGISGYSTGGRTNVGVYGHGYFNQNFSGNSTNSAEGGRFTSRITNAVTDFNGALYGTYNHADASAGVATGGFVYGAYNLALGAANTTTYGMYAEAQGGTFNYGVYSDAQYNYFSGSVGIGAKPPSYPLHVVANATDLLTLNSTSSSNANRLTMTNPYGTVKLEQIGTQFRVSSSAGTAAFTVDVSTGRMGIGAAPAGNDLDIWGGRVLGLRGGNATVKAQEGWLTLQSGASQQLIMTGSQWRFNGFDAGALVNVRTDVTGRPTVIIRELASQTADVWCIQNDTGATKYDQLQPGGNRTFRCSQFSVQDYQSAGGLYQITTNNADHVYGRLVSYTTLTRVVGFGFDDAANASYWRFGRNTNETDFYIEPGVIGSGMFTGSCFRLSTTGKLTLAQGLAYRSGTADPTGSDLESGAATVWKNTTSGEVKLAVNDGGVIKSVTLT